MAINKNSNAYIIIYTVVMVVIVGALLAFLATSLKDKQAANVLNEKKVSIMKAFGSADENFDDVVTIGYITDGKFVEVNKEDSAAVAEVFAALADLKGLTEAENNFPIFKYEKDGVTKYVAPMAGKGLWGDIWGYVSLIVEDGKAKISGIVMDHAGETPGLGAEIATEKWQQKFQGKVLYNAEGEFAVRMQKGGAQNEHQVDAITGGTKTCDGVNAMLLNSIGKYKAFLDSLSTSVAEDTTLEAAETPEAAEEVVEEATTEEANVEPTKVEEE
jgi:Na+-transporting NADH:ubiquinone oxidoreductase subunit C